MRIHGNWPVKRSCRCTFIHMQLVYLLSGDNWIVGFVLVHESQLLKLWIISCELSWKYSLNSLLGISFMNDLSIYVDCWWLYMLNAYMLLLVIIYVECIYVDGEIFYMRFGAGMLVKACIGICWCRLMKLHEACLLLSSPSSHTLLLLPCISSCCCWILWYSLCGLLCGLLWCFCCIRGDGLGDERKLVPHLVESE